MEIVSCDNKEMWNKWLLENQPEGSFVQSWEWGEILLSEKQEVERLRVTEQGSVVAQAQVVYKLLPLGWKYGFCGKGAVFGYRISDIEYLEKIMLIFINYLAHKDCIFLRLEPFINIQYPISNILIKQVSDVNPSTTAVLDLAKPIEKVVASMHKKTRYCIRKAEENGLVIEPKKDLEVFWNLLNETAGRDGFSLHGKGHYEAVLASTMTRQITILSRGKPVATAVFVLFGKTLTYLFSASDHSERELYAPYFIQLAAIKLGQQLGCLYYDMFGVAPRNESRNMKHKTGGDDYVYDSKHHYAGITQFKARFGGKIISSPGTFDLIIFKNKYRMYEILRKIRRIF